MNVFFKFNELKVVEYSIIIYCLDGIYGYVSALLFTETT